MLVSLFILAAVVSTLLAVILATRATRRREIGKAFRAATLTNSHGDIEFSGAQAVVVASHLGSEGSDAEGSDYRLRRSHLCTMPSGGFFEVVVQSSSPTSSATATVSKLNEQAFHHLRGRYPYSQSRAGDA